MTIPIRHNAFVALRTIFPDVRGQHNWVHGRLDLTAPHDQRRFITLRGEIQIYDISRWKIMHWHNQPEEADDSPAWVLTREAIANAMWHASKNTPRRIVRPVRRPQPPKESV